MTTTAESSRLSRPPGRVGTGIRTLGRGVRRFAFHLAFAGIVVLGLTLMGVLPISDYRQQGAEIARNEAKLASIQAQNQELIAQKVRLGTDAEVERLAREQLGMVPAGKEAFAIPDLRPGKDAISEAPRPAPETVEAPPEAPVKRRSALRELFDTVAFWN
jgi:cell division protein FtsB